MRLNRALALLAMAVAIGIALIWVEGQNFRMQQKLSELDRQREMLTEEQARLRLAVSRLSTPAQVRERIHENDLPLHEPQNTADLNQPRTTIPLYLHR